MEQSNYQDQGSYQLSDILEVLRRRRWHFLITLGALLIITFVVTFSLPSIYRSTATILIEEEEIPSDLIRSTISSYADQQIQVITQRVMTSERLLSIIDEFGLYADRRNVLSSSELVDKAREDTTMEMVSASVIDPRNGRPTQATIAFQLSFDYESPNIAQRVASRLVTLYMSANIEERQKTAQAASQFFAQEAAKLNQEINSLEEQLSRFKQEHDGALPYQYTANVQSAQRTENDLLETDRMLRSLEERRIYLASELAQVDRAAPVRLGSGQTLLQPAEQLRALRSEYANVLALYGENYPDVIRLKRQIESLEKQTGVTPSSANLDAQITAVGAELTAARDRYTDDHPEVLRLERQLAGLEAERADAGAAQRVTPSSAVTSAVTVRASNSAESASVGRLYTGQSARLVEELPDWYRVTLDDGTDGYVSRAWTTPTSAAQPATVNATNPAFIQLSAQYQATEADMRSLVAKRQVLAQRLEQIRLALANTPEVERVYNSLARDIDALRLKYRDLKAKEREARLSQEVEQNRKGQRFSLIEPPVAPTAPHWPNRLAWLLLGLVLSLAGSIGLVAVIESLDDAIRGTERLTTLIGAAPLAVIPYIPAEAQTDSVDTRRLMLIVGGIAAAIVVVLLAVHFLYEPLDVLWFRAMRKLGV